MKSYCKCMECVVIWAVLASRMRLSDVRTISCDAAILLARELVALCVRYSTSLLHMSSFCSRVMFLSALSSEAIF